MRPVIPDDLDALEKFAHSTSVGITNLPDDRSLLLDKIRLSQTSFSKEVHTPYNELYLFVLEDLLTHEIGGTCGIFSKTGVTSPGVFFQLETETNAHSSLPIPPQLDLLKPVIRDNGPSEICSLYLSPEFRKEGLGRLLSLSRFLFMAAFSSRFDSITISEMRGVIRRNDTSPFWDSLGSHFLNAKFSEALTIMERTPKLLSEFLPKHPIYVTLLPARARLVIGRTHPKTRPATRMLEKEGFKKNGEVDLLDGGPHLEAKTAEIRTVKQSRCFTVKNIVQTPVKTKDYLVSNERIDFRSSVAPVKVHKSQTATVSGELAEALKLELDDTIRIASLHPPRRRGIP